MPTPIHEVVHVAASDHLSANLKMASSQYQGGPLRAESSVGNQQTHGRRTLIIRCDLLEALDSMEFTVEQFNGLTELPGDVRLALIQAESTDFQGSADWYSLLSDTALHSFESPQVLTLRQGGQVVAVLPTLQRPSGGGLEMAALANFYTTRFVPMLSEELRSEDLAILLRNIRHHSPRASRICFAPMDRTGRGYALLLQSLRHAGFVTFEYFCFGNWYLPVAQNFDAYLAARPGEARNTLRRMARKIDKAGGRVEIIGPDGDVETAITAFNAVYASSWKQPEPFPGFMPALIRLCATKGWLRMGVVWMGEQPIAVQLWVVGNGKASIFKLAYDAAFSRYSPGSVLTAALLRHAMDIDRVSEIDYMTGDDAYKQDWMTERRELWGLMAFDPRQARGAAEALRETSVRAVKLVLGRFRPSAHA